MLRIYCPYCLEHRDEVEFVYAGEAHIVRPVDPDAVTDEEWGDYMFFRTNPRGMHRELWHHAVSCRRFFGAVRHTVSYDIIATYKLDESPTPREDES